MSTARGRRTGRRSRGVRTVAVLVAVITTLVGVLANPASAAGPASAPPDPSTFRPSPVTGGRVFGDITGDGLQDRIVLGRLGPDGTSSAPCAVQIRAGRSRTATTFVLPVPLAVGVTAFACPDIGTVTVDPSGNRLAVSYFLDPSPGSPSVQLYSPVGNRMVYRAGFQGMFHPARIASQDFNGDGYGDLWEETGEGFGFSSYLVRGTGVQPLFAIDSGTWPSVQFFDLNHNPGTDILLGVESTPGHPAQAIAVDGRTGAAQILTGSDDASGFEISLVDIDHDDYPDLRVQADDGWGTIQPFYNRCFGGRWSFTSADVG